MNSKMIVTILLYLVLAIGTLGAGDLVWNEIMQGDVCPKLLGIPACYIILACFVVPLLVHIFDGDYRIYYLFTGIAFAIALPASILQFLDIAQCPKTGNGTPMCYYSLALFTSLIGLKWLLRKWSFVKN